MLELSKLLTEQDQAELLGEQQEEEISPSNTWPDPEPINSVLRPVLKIPPEIIPEPLRGWAVNVAHRMQCPLDFVAVTEMVMAGSIIGAGCGIKPKKRDDWLVVPNLWGALIGGPSTLKTPAQQEALKPIAKLESQSKKEYEEALASHEAEREAFKAQREALKDGMKAAAKGKNKNSEDTIDTLKGKYKELEPPEAPIWRRYKSNDATIEKISELLSQNDRGILISRDELMGLLSSWDKDNRQSDRAFFLEAWNGIGGATSDRIGRGTIHVDNLCISLIGGIQPAKLLSYLHQAQSDLENDGLMQRMQLAVYPDENKNWQLVDEYPDSGAKERAYRVIEILANMNFEHYGAEKDGKGIPYFHFADDPQELFYEWITQLEEKLKADDDQPVMLEHLGKYRSLMPSLALVDHLVNLANGAPSGPVSLGSAQRAAAWCEYLESHAKRIYGLVADISQKAAAELAKKLKAGKLKDGFTHRDVYRNGWHLLTDKETVKAACNELIEANWLRETIYPEGKTRIQYSINPKFLLKSEG